MSWDGKIYDKYRVSHTDGTPLRGKKYFVLRLDSDNPVEAARVAAAMRAYKNELRNCDVGTVEEQAQRFYNFCTEHSSAIHGMCNYKCPCIDSGDKCHCLCKWAQMPYEEGGAR